MELTEMEKRMLYQTEGCERYAIINELSMASQYADNPARRKAARDLMEKLRPLSDAGLPIISGRRSGPARSRRKILNIS